MVGAVKKQWKHTTEHYSYRLDTSELDITWELHALISEPTSK